MVAVVLLNEAQEEHLKEVESYMLENGTPVIKVVFDESAGVYVALEGSHRLHAAKALGITPIFEEYDLDVDCMLSDYVDLDADDYPMAEIVGDYWRRPIIDFNQVDFF